MNNYNNIDYIKQNIKDSCYIHFEYKNSMCSLYIYSTEDFNNKNQIYFSCDTMYYEMDTQYFNTIEEFFEEGTVEGELIKDVWDKVKITGITGF